MYIIDNLGERIAFYNTALFPQRPAPKQRVFVTIPRIKPGNPASLAEVVPGDRPGSVLLSPYPSWKANTVVEERVHCDDTIVSVFRTKVSDYDYKKPLCRISSAEGRRDRGYLLTRYICIFIIPVNEYN